MATGPAKPFAAKETAWSPENPYDGTELDPAQLTVVRRPEGWRLRHLMYLIVIVAVLLWMFILIGSFLLVAVLVLGVAAAIGGGVILARRRATRQDSLLCVMAIAAEREMPLPPAIGAFADQYRGKSYRRIMNLAAYLDHGANLPEALEWTPRVMSRDAVLLSWIGQATGKLPKALRLAATARTNQLPIWTAIAGRLSYILGLMLAMQFIGTFLMYFIIPKLEAIFKDFNLPLPQITVDTIMASHFVVRYSLLFIPIGLLELGLLFYIPVSFLVGGSYDFPLFPRLLRRRHTALILRSLALVVEADKPISLGLSTLSDHYPTRWVRRKLLTAESEVQQGGDWIESLLRQGLIRSADADVLRSAASVGNLPWALAELAETNERRLAMKLQALTQLLFPLVVITLGFVVFLFAMAYFAPLVKLISELSKV